MAVPVIESYAAANATSTATTLVISKPTGTVAGDLLVAVITPGAGATMLPVTDPSGWADATSVGLGQRAISVHWIIAGGSEPSTYTFTFAGSTRSIGAIFRISGADTTTPINVSATDDANGVSNTTIVNPSITTTVADALALWIGNTAPGDRTFTGTGIVWQLNQSNSLTTRASTYVASETISSAGATGTRSYTFSGGNENWCSVSVAIAPAAGGGGGGASATATSGDIDVAGSQGSAAATANVSVQATSGSVEIAGEQAVASATANLVVSATAGTADISGQQGTATSTANVTAVASPGAAQISGEQGSASATAGVTAFAGAGAAEIAGEIGSVATTANIAVSAVSGALALDGEQGSVSFTANVSTAAVSGAAKIAGSVGVSRVDSGSPEVSAQAGVIYLAGQEGTATASGQKRGGFIPARHRPRFEVVFYTPEEVDDLPDEGPIKPTPAKRKQIKKEILGVVIDPFSPPEAKEKVSALVETRLARVKSDGKAELFAMLNAIVEEAKRRADEIEREIEEEDMMILSWAA